MTPIIEPRKRLCRGCKEEWIVSKKAPSQKVYICPVCSGRERNRNGKGNRVRLRNDRREGNH